MIAGIPVCDLPRLFHLIAPAHVRSRAAQHGILEGNAELVHRVVSPIAMPCQVPCGVRYGFGARERANARNATAPAPASGWSSNSASAWSLARA